MTTSEQKSSAIFYGWWVVLASGVGLALHIGPIIVATFGVFLKPLSQEFGWSRAQISLAFSLATLGATVVVPFIGRLVDRFGARRVILPAVLLFGLSVLSLSFLSAHLWHFYAIYLLMGVVGSGTTPVPYAKVLSRWFDRKRGLALGLAVAALAEALTVVDKSGERFYEAELYRLKGQLTLQEASQKSKGKSQKSKMTDPQPPISDPQAEAEAEACFLKAIEIARKQQAKSLKLRAVMSLVRLRQLQVTSLGSRITQHETRIRLTEAHHMLSEIYNWFTEGFDTKDLQEAQTLLEELQI